jgi:23S rRNA (cytosine1962-C5)-methyltransferase
VIPTVTVTSRGAARWRAGHPWIYRSDVLPTRAPAGIARVLDRAGRFLGQALLSPASEIRLRFLTRADEAIDTAWWVRHIGLALERRASIAERSSAYRVVHGEGDGLPALIVDRYGEYVVAQLLSAGLEARRGDVLAAIEQALAPSGMLLRHDASVRRHERLPVAIENPRGQVPDEIEVAEDGVRYVVFPRTGQKTGAFLDQRDNRLKVQSLARGRCLDAFTYQGLFALHMARRAATVLAVDSSRAALEAARRNAALNGGASIEWREANAFDLLRALERDGERFDTIVLDPPAFAKTKSALPRALAGYKEINLRSMRLLASGGLLFTASCSFHLGRDLFLRMLSDAAADSGRRLVLCETVGQPLDHPELITVPETGYLKGAFLLAHD